MKSSIPVMVDRPSRHAASTGMPGSLHIPSVVGMTSKLETVDGFSRNRRTIHPHVGVSTRRRQHELTSSATHEMHLPPKEVGPLSFIDYCLFIDGGSFSIHREVQLLGTTSQASMPLCHKYLESQEFHFPEHPPLPLPPCHICPHSLCPTDRNTHCPRPSAGW